MNGAPRRGSGFFRGWVVAWAAFTSLTVAFGASYSFAAFFKPWADEFAATRADVSWVFGLASLLYFGLGALGGSLADRYGPRRIAIAGMLTLAAGLLLSSRAGELSSVYLAYGLGIGLGVALVYTPAMGAVQPWFVKQRGLASGIASAGIGAGTLIVPLLMTWLIDAFGWRVALQVTAAGSLLIGLAAAWLLERDPAAYGWQADGIPLRAAAGRQAEGPTAAGASIEGAAASSPSAAGAAARATASASASAS
ncbi:MAG: MFS transporter, partial [Burkholderiaceae bacterium]